MSDIITTHGLPYQGSKSKLAEQILALFPPATHFVDVFAGGCAISHAALLSGKYEHVHANDITDSVVLFKDALNGDLAKYEPERFRSRMDFFMEKDENPFVRICYSFSNGQRSYLYGSDIEPYKRAVHEMIYAPTPNERRLKFKTVIREMEKLGVFGGNTPPPNSNDAIGNNGKSGERLVRLQSAERNERINEVRLHRT